MKQIKAYVRPNMKDRVVDAIEEMDEPPGLTVTSVTGWGHPQKKDAPHGLDERAKLEIVVPDHRLQHVIDTIVEQAQTGRYGDGKIFVTDVTEAVRIRDEETGSDIA
jgi:nitrogen regulatory protein P-II 1